MDSHDPPSGFTKWGLVQGWLAADLERSVEIRATVTGLRVRVVDPVLGEASAGPEVSEDPSAAAWRAILRLDDSR